MNYTYLPSSPYSTAPVIIMTTNPASRKTINIRANPSVSLLVHDCKSYPFTHYHSPFTPIPEELTSSPRDLPSPPNPLRPPALRWLPRSRTAFQLSLPPPQPKLLCRLQHQRHHRRSRPDRTIGNRGGEALPRAAPRKQYVRRGAVAAAGAGLVSAG